MAHIKAYFLTIRPYNNKEDGKNDPSLRRRRRIIHDNNHSRNMRFQLPLISTANQILWHCSNSQSALRQNLAAVSKNLREFVSGPTFSGSR